MYAVARFVAGSLSFGHMKVNSEVILVPDACDFALVCAILISYYLLTISTCFLGLIMTSALIPSFVLEAMGTCHCAVLWHTHTCANSIQTHSKTAVRVSAKYLQTSYSTTKFNVSRLQTCWFWATWDCDNVMVIASMFTKATYVSDSHAHY